MAYSLESSKWKAYQFSDPLAVGSFYVCNKSTQVFCRPDCDAQPIINLQLEIQFVTDPNTALELGYQPCESCDPLHCSIIDVDLLIKCICTVNHQIGFISPLLDEDEEYNTKKIKENILETKRANEQQIIKTINNVIAHDGRVQHRYSLPIINAPGTKGSKDMNPSNTTISKNDSDHYRLVDLACRHLALAAALSVFQPHLKPLPQEEMDDDNQDNSKKRKRRRRRGGVLGFKELAAKSKLSAWHFHRVFKSVTGLTPKTYGDKCWEFFKRVERTGEYTSFQDNGSAYSVSPQPYQSPPLSTRSDKPPSKKRIKLENNSNQTVFKTNLFSGDYTQIQPHQNISLNDTIITPPNEVQYTISPRQQQQQQQQQHSAQISSINTTNTSSYSDFLQALYPNDILEEQLQALSTTDGSLFHPRAFSAPNLSRLNSSTLFGLAAGYSESQIFGTSSQPQLQPQAQPQHPHQNEVLQIPNQATFDFGNEVSLPELVSTADSLNSDFGLLQSTEQTTMDGNIFMGAPNGLMNDTVVTNIGSLMADEQQQQQQQQQQQLQHELFATEPKYNPQLLASGL